MKFEKATLQEVSSAPSASPQPTGSPIEVQINPASLRLQMQNTVDAGKAFARPATQYQGSSSSTLKEACSWGKVDTAHEQMVYAEATSVLPLLASDAYHRGHWKDRAKRAFAKLFS